MAADNPVHTPKPPLLTAAEVTAHVKNELDKEAERSHIQASKEGLLHMQSGIGVTIDISSRAIKALPAEVCELIKDRVDRYGYDRIALATTC